MTDQQPESAIGKDEKNKIKTKALQIGIVEPEVKLARQNALMISKILRFEFPQDWYGSSTNIFSLSNKHMRS